MLLQENKIVRHNGGAIGARTDAFINLETKNHVVVCGDSNCGTFPVAIDLVSYSFGLVVIRFSVMVWQASEYE
jgi:hypothetical protein